MSCRRSVRVVTSDRVTGCGPPGARQAVLPVRALVASPPRPGLAAELPAVPLGLHKLRAVFKRGPYLGDRRNALAREVPEQAFLDLSGEQRLALPREHDRGLLLHVRIRERGEQNLSQARYPTLLQRSR